MLQIWEFFSQVVLAPDEVNREELAVSDANIAKKKHMKLYGMLIY